ncbi:hypothetical protein PF007_g13189 [Phytophthora fragariae]|uniref:Jacalin-type lectin domain-containing protein n=1 Tax=Phytophthora fragariae TaxID=53985 RepID=A0A6A3S0Q3_9STRA|nr:hypothetical protein PF007_g13189 [Phytophthora fragariae]
MAPLSVLRVLLLLLVAVVHGTNATSDEDVQLSEAFGGSGGVSFSDITLIEFGQTASSITISAKRRVTSIVLQVATPAELTLSHGGSSGTDHTLTLAEGEYVQSMEVHWARKGLSSRVFYLKLGTNKGNSVSAGTATENNSTVTAPEGFQLSGFFGRAEGELNQECIPQNDDCTGEVMSKAVSVVAAVFNTVTAGIFGAMFSSYKNAKQSFLCAANIIGVIKSLIYYLRFQRTTAPQGSVQEMLAIAYQSNVVIFDLPVAVANCLGIKVSGKVKFADIVYVIVENIVKQVIINGDQILSSATNVLALLTNTSTINNSTDESTVEELQDLLDSNSTCGYQLKNLTDHVITSRVTSRAERYPHGYQ